MSVNNKYIEYAVSRLICDMFNKYETLDKEYNDDEIYLKDFGYDREEIYDTLKKCRLFYNDDRDLVDKILGDSFNEHTFNHYIFSPHKHFIFYIYGYQTIIDIHFQRYKLFISSDISHKEKTNDFFFEICDINYDKPNDYIISKMAELIKKLTDKICNIFLDNNRFKKTKSARSVNYL